MALHKPGGPGCQLFRGGGCFPGGFCALFCGLLRPLLVLPSKPLFLPVPGKTSFWKAPGAPVRRCENGSPPCIWYSGPRPCVPLLPDVPGLYGAQSESRAAARFLPQAQNGVRLPCRHFPVPLQKSCHARSCERNRWQHGLCVFTGPGFFGGFCFASFSRACSSFSPWDSMW